MSFFINADIYLKSLYNISELWSAIGVCIQVRNKWVSPKFLIIYHNSVSIDCRTFACLKEIQISTLLFDIRPLGLGQFITYNEKLLVLYIILH